MIPMSTNAHLQPEPFQPDPRYRVSGLASELASLRDQLVRAVDHNLYLQACLEQIQVEHTIEVAELTSRLTPAPHED
jgi:hypothetical protein